MRVGCPLSPYLRVLSTSPLQKSTHRESLLRHHLSAKDVIDQRLMCLKALGGITQRTLKSPIIVF